MLQARFEGLSGDVDAAHAHLSECIIVDATVGGLDLTGAVLTDVGITALRATEVKARNSRWRDILVSGGRIGTLDLTGADLTGVELRGIRIDYLALGSAKVSDLLMAECTIGSLDVPLATLSRVRFESTRVDEVDSRGVRAEHVDLRGLEALAFTDLSSLRGVTLSARQVELLATSFAAALGIDVRD
ncbi:pentapeptide repeat-containing protein [Microbacterium lacus]|uniref:pentapeptide repeat-containing protein n=1 Tax=Microbacterium lacus TaxID=415217 RepID=UPI00384AA908